MEHFRSIQRRDGVDVGYHESNLEPLNGVGRFGVGGIDKTFSFERMLELAHEINANIIIKAGPNAKWYLKRCPVDEIEGRIANQARWRNGTFRYKMWIVEWKDREE